MRLQHLILLYAVATASVYCENNIIWVHQSLDDQPSSPPFNIDYLTWGSSEVITLNGKQTVKISSLNSNTIQKHFDISIPHASLVVQATFFENGCLDVDEGFSVTLSSSPSTFYRFSSGNEFIPCEEGFVKSYIERLTVPTNDLSYNVQFSSFINNQLMVQPNKTLSFREFKIGVEPCEKSCALCSPIVSVSNNGDPHSSLCLNCPDNAEFEGETNICKCKADFEEDYSFGYLKCVEGDVDDNSIPAYCKDELLTYSTRTRVGIVTQQILDNSYLVNINSYQFFPVVPESCRPYLRQHVLVQDKLSNQYNKLGAQYIQSQEIGDSTVVLFSNEDFVQLQYFEVTEDGNTSKVINLALQFKIGSVVSRIHHFQVFLESEIQTGNILLSELNTDYQLNLNFISPASYGNQPAFLKEYLFEVKRFFCQDNTCKFQRSTQGYHFNEEIIFRIAFKSSLNQQHLTLHDATVFGNNQEFDVKSAITTLEDGQGYLTLSLNQQYIKTPVDNGQSTNKAYLQATVSFLDNPADLSSEVRIAQIDLLFFALFTPDI